MARGQSTTRGSSGRGSGTRGRASAPSLTSLEGLAAFAASKGFEKEAEKALKPPKLSLLERLGRTLTSFETGDALYRKRYEDASLLSTYTSDVRKGLQAGITGGETRIKPKKTYKDILVKEGFKDRPGKIDLVDVLGLAGDILFDPTTYFGGAIAKGAVKGVKVGFKAGKTVPGLGKALTTVEKSAQGATAPFRELFQPGFKIKQLNKLGFDGEKVFDQFTKLAKTKRALTDDFLGEAAKKAKVIKKVSGKQAALKAGGKIGVAIEKGVKTGDAAMDDMLNYLVDFSTKQGEKLKNKGIIDDMLPNWMHHMLTPEAADGMRIGAPFIGLNKLLKVTKGKHREMQGTVEEVNKWAQKNLGYDMFEKDAFKAFAKSGARSIQDIENYDFLQRIGHQFGKQGTDDFIEPGTGIKWVKPKLGGIGEKALGANTRMPQPVAEHMEKVFDFLTNDDATKGFLRMYDKLHNFWKATVTGYFPAFHTRNAIGGTFNNWIAGVSNPLRYAQNEAILKGGNKVINLPKHGKMSYDELLKVYKEQGVIGQTGFLDVGEFLKKEIAPTATQRVTRAPQKVMGAFEDRMRGTLFLDRVIKGDTFEQAAKTTLKYHFDYMPEGFTKFEKDFMKRVIPFYTWTRHNIPLQLEQMVMQPGKYSGVFKTGRTLGIQPDSDEESVLPRWLRDRFMVKAQGGYWSGIGLPLEEATEKLAAPMRGFGMSLSPMLKIPVEKLTGYNIFKEKQIDEDDYGKYYRNAPEFLKNWLDMKKHTSKAGDPYWTVNPRKKYWLEVVGSRGLNTALRLANGVQEEESRLDLLSLITTIRSYDYSIEDLKRWSDVEKRQELEGRLKRAGEVDEFSRLYIQKN